MAAKRKQNSHETGDAKMKMAALKYANAKPSVKPVESDDTVESVPSPALELQERLQSHYQPLNKQLSVILVSLLVAFAFVGGWLAGTGGGGVA